MRVAFAGTPGFAVPALETLRDNHEVVGVLTQPDRPAGRGRQLAQSEVKRHALAAGLAVAQPSTLRTAEGRAPLVEWRPDVLVVVAYGLLLPPEVLDLPRHGCLNIHASLLPRWRGAAPVQRAIEAGDAETGVSIMRMDAGLDTGPVYLQRRVRIDEHATGGTLLDVLAPLGAAALLEVLDSIEAGRAVAIAQPAEGATYARKITKAEALIDWSCDAATIARRVRAFDPWPMTETRLEGEQLRVLDARPAPVSATALANAALGVTASATAAHGRVLGLHDGALLVACGAGALAITKLQRAGRKPVTAREFASGADVESLTFGH